MPPCAKLGEVDFNQGNHNEYVHYPYVILG